MRVSGIYKIINKTNGKYYVGSSGDILGSRNSSGRFYNHKRMLRQHKHHCVHLQRAYDLDGEKSFEYVIVKHIDESDLLVVEQRYLDIAKNNSDSCYNSSFDVGKITMTEEIRQKIGKKKKAWLADPTHHHMYGKKHKKIDHRQNQKG